ncbi:MAG: YajQ family cyclic di-GMP-binding protein [Bacteroidota bacterium]|nr:YajQ family cyclic di-GMP-binding protein [Bacteroidota bacterium]
MASFDIVSKVDGQTLDNAINAAIKEVANRYDFRGSKTEIELQKKESKIIVVTEDSMKLGQIEDLIRQKLSKQGIDPRVADFGKEEYASGNMIRKEIVIKQGMDKEMAKKVVKQIKDLKLKVEPAIMEDQVRVSAKKIDDLQEVINALRGSELEIPMQFINMK